MPDLYIKSLIVGETIANTAMTPAVFACMTGNTPAMILVPPAHGVSPYAELSSIFVEFKYKIINHCFSKYIVCKEE